MLTSSDHYFEGWPCKRVSSSTRGRYAVATRDLEEGEVVLVSEAYLSIILKSHKRRVCALCYTDARRRLSLCCGLCHHAHYCSAECMAAHMVGSAQEPSLAATALSQLSLVDEQCISGGGVSSSGQSSAPPPAPPAGAPRSSTMVPHSLVCPVVKQFASAKWGPDNESMMLGVLQLLAMELVEQQQQQQEGVGAAAAGAAGQLCPPLPPLSHADFMQLQSHAADYDLANRADWLKCAGQLLCMMRKAGWPGVLPSPEQVLDLCSRIASNNFGIYAPPPPPPAGPAPEEQLQGEAGRDGQPKAAGAEPGQHELGEQQVECSVVPASAGACSAQPGSLQGAQRRAAAREREELIGREVYITASYFNHSCDPNCVVHRGFKTTTVMARGAIKAGEELLISYIDLELPRSARRAHLLKYFHFECGCPRCEREAAEGSARCSYQLSKGKTSAPKRRGRKARVSR